MKTIYRFTIILCCVLMLDACGASNPDTEPTTAPTDSSPAAPSATITPVPTDTPAPTDIPEPTETPVPTETPIPTDTPTPTRTPIPMGTLKGCALWNGEVDLSFAAYADIWNAGGPAYDVSRFHGCFSIDLPADTYDVGVGFSTPQPEECEESGCLSQVFGIVVLPDQITEVEFNLEVITGR